MAVANTLASYLEQAGIAPELLTHPPTPSATRTAEASHVSGDRVAKGVLLKAEEDYVLAVVPASHRLVLELLAQLTGRELQLASEEEIGRTFPDCELGAVPGIGAPWGLPVVVDDSLAGQPEIYLEAGDHETLLRVTRDEFATLTPGAQLGVFSRHD
jgi:Ala-tRNA(Pro) deacylase